MKFYISTLLFLTSCICESSVSAIENLNINQSEDGKISKVGVVLQAHQKNNEDELLTAVGVVTERSQEVACIFDQNEFKKIPQLFARHQDFNIPPGIQFLDETINNSILAYEDLFNAEINFENLNNEEDEGDDDEDVVENEYTFISKNQLSEKEYLGILAFNDEKISTSSDKNYNEIVKTMPIDNGKSSSSVLVTIQKLVEGKKLVTNQQYNKFLESRGEPKIYLSTENKDEHPVIDISLEEAKKYAQWRNKTLVIQQNKSHGIGVGLLSETQDKVEWIPIPLPNQWN